MSTLTGKLRPYKHVPFAAHHSVRLLYLEPAIQSQAPIRFTLEEVSLDNLPDYEALSYAWESQTPDCPVYCYRSQLLITQNCFSALRRLRDKSQKRRLWIDSICIDQNCVEEREQQVQLMGDVYSKAKKVVIWLGESTDLSDFMISHLKSCYEIRTTGNAQLRKLEENSLKLNNHLLRAKAQSLERQGQHSLELLYSITSRSWFTRMWAVQEYLLSKNADFMCGALLINSTAMLSEMDKLDFDLAGRHSRLSGLFQVLEGTKKVMPVFMYLEYFMPLKDRLSTLADSSTYSTPITDLLSHTRPARATNPKDKVYGMHGILKNMGIEMPLPRYEQEVERVYIEATRAAIEHDQCLHTLLGAVGSKDFPLLPSWVPDWNMPISDAFSPEVISMGKYRATRSSKATFRFLEDNLLSVRGLITCSITNSSVTSIPEPSNAVSKEDFDLRIREVFREWVLFAQASHPYASKEGWEDMLRLTMAAEGSWVDTSIPGATANFGYWAKCLFLGAPDASDTLGNHGQDLNLLGINGDVDNKNQFGVATNKLETRDLVVSEAIRERPEVADWEATMANRTVGMRLFKTSSGYFGKGPARVKDGDTLLLIAGIPVPLVARAVGTAFKLIGPAYVYGIMEEEVWPVDEGELIDIIII